MQVGALGKTKQVREMLPGCPCGCESKPPYVDDPACIRHKPVLHQSLWPNYDEAMPAGEYPAEAERKTDVNPFAA